MQALCLECESQTPNDDSMLCKVQNTLCQGFVYMVMSMRGGRVLWKGDSRCRCLPFCAMQGMLSANFLVVNVCRGGGSLKWVHEALLAHGVTHFEWLWPLQVLAATLLRLAHPHNMLVLLSCSIGSKCLLASLPRILCVARVPAKSLAARVLPRSHG